MRPTTAARAAPLLTIAMLTGFAGLGYEVVWTRMLAFQLGHDITAALGVITAFFAGLALGAVTLGTRAARSTRPDRWYALLELVVAAWAVSLVWLVPASGGVVSALLGVAPGPVLHWAVALLLPLVLLLPATVAMGGTLPALVAMLGRGTVGVAYAVNTAGAVAGTLAATFVIAPALSFSATLLLLAAVNALCAAAALRLGPGAGPGIGAHVEVAPPGIGDRRRLVTLLATGLLGIGYEVLAIRVLGQLLENTVYTFAALLSAYLLGTALGGALPRRVRATEPAVLLDRLLAATAVACLLGTAVLFGADAMLAWLRAGLPGTVTGAIGAELLLGAAVLLLPAVGMGALFGHLGQMSAGRPGGLGRALGANTLGAALAPALFGVLVLPAFGAKAGLAAVAIGYAALARPRTRTGWAIAAVPALAAAVLLLPSLRLGFVRVPPGGAIVAEREGVTASVAVVRDRDGEHVLQVNSHFRQGGTATVRADRRLAYLPLLLHPAPERALFLGLGTGITLAAAADLPGLQVDGVELVPEILPLLPLFARAAGEFSARPNVSLYAADARRFVRAAPDRYDAIVADLYYPAVDGAGALYTAEHFAAIRARLAPGGVFCQWLPLHQMGVDTVRLIARTFLDAFPDGSAWVANFSTETPLLALVGGAAPGGFAPGWFDRLVSNPVFRTRLRENGLSGDLGLFGLFLAGPESLGTFAGPGPRNTDDHPRVTFEAPAAAYAATEAPAARLLALLDRLRPRPTDLLPPDTPAAIAEQFEAYWRARDGFLRLGAAETASGVRPESTAGTIGRIAPQLLAVVRISPAFEPAYDPLLAMARALHRTDPAAALRLLRDLDAAAPARPDARRLLAQLTGGAAR